MTRAIPRWRSRLVVALATVWVVTGARAAPEAPRPRPAARDAAAASRPAPATLGRLFFTADERQRIDAGVGIVGGPVTTGPAPFRIDGVLRRADGSEVVWIDGVAAPPGGRDAGLVTRVLRDPAQVSVQRDGGPATVLRAGQRSDRPGLGEGNAVELHR